MKVHKEHLLAVIMIAVVALSYVAQRVQNESARTHDRETAIKLCVAGVERSSYIANGFRILESRVGKRDAPGDQKSAADYRAVAASIVLTFPGIAKQDSRVERVESSDGSISFRIPAESHALQERGCRQAYQ